MNMHNGPRYGFGEEWETIRRPFFQRGRISSKRSNDEIMKSFIGNEGREPSSFEQEVDNIVCRT